MSQLTPNMSALGMGLIAGAIVAYIILIVAAYVLTSTIYFFLFRKARVKLAWLAYVPLGQLWPFLWTIKKSAWNILWFILPFGAAVAGAMMNDALGGILLVIGSIIPLVFWIIWQVRLLKAFSMNPWLALIIIGFVVPFVGFLFQIAYLVLMGYLAFSAKVQYNPNFDGSGGGSDEHFYN